MGNSILRFQTQLANMVRSSQAGTRTRTPASGLLSWTGKPTKSGTSRRRLENTEPEVGCPAAGSGKIFGFQSLALCTRGYNEFGALSGKGFSVQASPPEQIWQPYTCCPIPSPTLPYPVTTHFLHPTTQVTLQNKVRAVPQPEELVLWSGLHEAMFNPVSGKGRRG